MRLLLKLVAVVYVFTLVSCAVVFAEEAVYKEFVIGNYASPAVEKPAPVSDKGAPVAEAPAPAAPAAGVAAEPAKTAPTNTAPAAGSEATQPKPAPKSIKPAAKPKGKAAVKPATKQVAKTKPGVTTAKGTKSVPAKPTPKQAAPKPVVKAGSKPGVAKSVAPEAVKPVTVTPVAPPKVERAVMPAARPSNPSPNDTKISMSFEKADINSIIKFLSQAANVPIVNDPALSGQISIVSLKQISVTHAFEVVNAALRVRGFTMVGGPESTVVKIVSTKKAIADGVPVGSGYDASTIVASQNLVTQVMGLQYLSATKMVTELKPLVADDQGSIVAVSSTNTLLITDSSGNVRRIAEIVKNLDSSDPAGAVEIEIYKCENSSAQAMVETLGKVFQLGKSIAAIQPNPNRGGGEGGPPQPPKPDEGLFATKGEVKITSDSRTNFILISATRPMIDRVMAVVKKLDAKTELEVKAKTFHLEHADCKMVAEQLGKLFQQPEGSGDSTRRSPYYYFGYDSGSNQSNRPGDYATLKRNQIVADVRTNSVIVTATDQNMVEFEKMIHELDSPQVLSEITHSYGLKYARAPDLAETLNSLFRGQYRRPGSFFDMFFGDSSNNRNDDGGPIADLKNITVVAEPKTNTLLVTGPPQSFEMVTKLIDQLDRRSPQVFLEVAIVDVTLDDNMKFGVEFEWLSGSKNPDGTSKQSVNNNLGLADLTTGLKYKVISDSLKALLHTLETRSNVKVYSNPAIMLVDNVKSHISIGQDVPYVTGDIQDNSGNFRRTVEFKSVAVALTVTPHINEASEWISMDVLQTINEVVGTQGDLDSPVIANREVETTLSVKNGQTIVIGGIIKENHEKLTKGVPVLSRIPIIGELFKSHTNRGARSELMVFLTPRIIEDEVDVDIVTENAKDAISSKPKESIKNAGG